MPIVVFFPLLMVNHGQIKRPSAGVRLRGLFFSGEGKRLAKRISLKTYSLPRVEVLFTQH